jgi:hypothetical protein
MNGRRRVLGHTSWIHYSLKSIRSCFMEESTENYLGTALGFQTVSACDILPREWRSDRGLACSRLQTGAEENQACFKVISFYSRQDILHHFSMNIGQTIIATLKAES